MEYVISALSQANHNGYSARFSAISRDSYLHQAFSPPSLILFMPSYRRLQQYAIAISVVSVLYNGAEGGISIGFGAESSSRSLVFFGIQSGIEVLSAFMVLWRFKKVAKPGLERAVLLSEKEVRYVYVMRSHNSWSFD